MLKNITPKKKLIFSIVVLSIIFLMLSASLVNFKYSKSQSLIKLESAIILATKFSKILHETQKERGMTTGFIANSGKKFKKQLFLQRKNTDKRIKELNQFLNTINISNTSEGIQSTLYKALERIKELSVKRKLIDAQSISSDDVISYYTDMNAHFLGTIIEISKVSELTNIAQNIIAYSNFLYSKENAGIERAIGTHIISKDTLDILRIIQFNNLISKQDLYRDIFLKYASIQSKSYYANFVKGTSVDEVSRMRSIIVSANKNDISKIDVKFWFNNITVKIDKLKIVDDYLANEIITNIKNEISNTNNELIIFIILNIANIIIFISMIIMILNFIKNEKKDKREIEVLTKKLEYKIKIEVAKNRDKDIKLMEQSKFSALGEMIGNIAHQWRQPLSAISSTASSMQVQMQLGITNNNDIDKSYSQIMHYTSYLTQTIEDFRKFVKGDKEKTIFNLRDKIKSTLLLVEGTIRNQHINIILDLEDDININSYSNEITQCIINIFNNAKDILHEKRIEDKFIFISSSKVNDKVIIKIKDNAGGIPENILPKIFEPYFTTKHQSQGTGLGLHMTYNLIVDGMNGTIEANNITYTHKGNNYTGAEFKFTLPI